MPPHTLVAHGPLASLSQAECVAGGLAPCWLSMVTRHADSCCPHLCRVWPMQVHLPSTQRTHTPTYLPGKVGGTGMPACRQAGWPYIVRHHSVTPCVVLGNVGSCTTHVVGGQKSGQIPDRYHTGISSGEAKPVRSSRLLINLLCYNLERRPLECRPVAVECRPVECTNRATGPPRGSDRTVCMPIVPVI